MYLFTIYRSRREGNTHYGSTPLEVLAGRFPRQACYAREPLHSSATETKPNTRHKCMFTLTRQRAREVRSNVIHRLNAHSQHSQHNVMLSPCICCPHFYLTPHTSISRIIILINLLFALFLPPPSPIL